MKRRQYIKATGAAMTASTLAGCAASSSEEPTGDDTSDDGMNNDGSDGTETGTLSTSVTDQPVDIGDFESCVVTIEGIWVKSKSAEDPDPDDDESTESDEDGPGEENSDAQEREGDGEDEPEDDEENAEENEDYDEGGSEPDEGSEYAPADESGGRRYIAFAEPQEADLVQLQGANTQLIDETELAVGEYQFLQLDVSGVEGVLVGGGEAEVETPGNAPLQFQQSYEIRADERTHFVADFAPVRRGRGSRYLIRPVATGTQVLYGDGEYDPEAGDQPEENDDESDAPDNETEDASNES